MSASTPARTGRFALFVALMVVMLAFLYHKTLSIDPIAPAAYETLFGKIRSHDERLDLDTLRILSGHLRNYDTLHRHTAGIAEGLAKLNTIPNSYSKDMHVRIQGALGKLAEEYSQKQDAVQRFTSDHAVLINSLYYLPTLVNEMEIRHGQDRELRSLLEAILTYNLHGLTRDRSTAEERLTELRTRKDNTTELEKVLIHAGHILTYKPRVDAHLDHILRSPLRRNMQSVAAIVSEANQMHRFASDLYRIALIVVCAVLAVGVLFFFYRLQRALADLRGSNENLEQRVITRTHELSQANDELRHQNEARQRAVDSLAFAHRRVEQILTIMPSALIGTDLDQRIIFWNNQAEALFRHPAKEVMGNTLCDCGILQGNASFTSALKRVGSQPTLMPEYSHSQENKPTSFLSITASRPDEGDGGIGLLMVATDITNKKAMESQLMQAQRMESIGQLAAGVAHEINTPIQFIGDNLSFLQSSCADLIIVLEHVKTLIDVQGDAVAHLRTAVENADVEYLFKEMPNSISQSIEGIERVAVIVRSMKEFSHPSKESQGLVDIHRTIQSTLNVARHEYKYVADVSTDFSVDVPLIHCNPGEMSQVVLNILVNAAHAIGDTVADGEKGTISISTKLAGDHLIIRMSDSGGGIPEPIRHRIFEPFFTTKEVGKGTGQGLYLAHDIVVNKHGGRLELEVIVGEGSTFVIHLPIAGVQPAP